MVIDDRIIQRHGTHAVLAQRYEIMWRDGSTVYLHPVTVDGAQAAYLRAIHHEGLTWLVIDVRQLAANIEADLMHLPCRDHPGVIFFSLRGAYPNAAAFGDAIARRPAVATWWHADLAEAA